MSPDDMANFHEYMAQWCRDKAEESGEPYYTSQLTTPQQTANPHHRHWSLVALEHDEAFQYWCRQANPFPSQPATGAV